MQFKRIHIPAVIITAIIIAMSLSSCSKQDWDFSFSISDQTYRPDIPRTVNPAERRVFIYMGLGHNNLSSHLQKDIEELAANGLPEGYWEHDVVLIYSHLVPKNMNYSTPCSPSLTRLYTNFDGSVKRDTLLIFDPDTKPTTAETINFVLNFVKDEFPASEYGMLISSHGSGWTPENYCLNPSKYETTSNNDSELDFWGRSQKRPTPAPLMDDEPLVKSIGVHNYSTSEISEIEITDLAEAIPLKMNYIIFDACFMGGVEVAYELKDKCDKIIFSQTEILADGMEYKTMISHLFNEEGTDLKGFCQSYYKHYNAKYGWEKSATISLVDCTQLDALAMACKKIFESYRTDLANIDRSSVQEYYRSGSNGYNYRWFYDLGSIISNCNTGEEDTEVFDRALQSSILYKASTYMFMSDIQIKTHSGLSMYLPYPDRTYLNNFYKTLKWNKATGLVE